MYLQINRKTYRNYKKVSWNQKVCEFNTENLEECLNALRPGKRNKERYAPAYFKISRSMGNLHCKWHDIKKKITQLTLMKTVFLNSNIK